MEESIKNDRKDKKLPWELLPMEEIEDIVKVYQAGAEKYGPNRWQNLPDGMNRYFAAAMRHYMEFRKGNEFDEETGCRHLAQMAWNVIAMLYISKHENKQEESLEEKKFHNCNTCYYMRQEPFDLSLKCFLFPDCVTGLPIYDCRHYINKDTKSKL